MRPTIRSLLTPMFLLAALSAAAIVIALGTVYWNWRAGSRWENYQELVAHEPPTPSDRSPGHRLVRSRHHPAAQWISVGYCRRAPAPDLPETSIPPWAHRPDINRHERESRSMAFGWPFRTLRGSIIEESGYVEELRGFILIDVGRYSGPKQTTKIWIPFHIWLPGLTANVGVYAIALGIPYLTLSLVRRSSRRLRGRCAECGYDLKSLGSDACPECGGAASRDRHDPGNRM